MFWEDDELIKEGKGNPTQENKIVVLAAFNAL